uniref:Uncharacterized protein n=1 Tax=Anguilla anguilla TaxID=7936 RepID=A0A0E9RM03_ANGAN
MHWQYWVCVQFCPVLACLPVFVILKITFLGVTLFPLWAVLKKTMWPIEEEGEEDEMYGLVTVHNGAFSDGLQ